MDLGQIREKYRALAPSLTERSRRIWAATEAIALGWGGMRLVVRATGISYSTIYRGIRELESGQSAEPDRVRRPGAGRKRCLVKDTTLLPDLESLIEPLTRGHPESPLRWTCKSTRMLSRELRGMGHEVSYRSVADILREAGYTLQSNRKAQEGRTHPDRNAQFEYINRLVRARQRARQPVISVDTKKKELVGNFKNAGREWHPKRSPERVRVHDFVIPTLGKAIPYGVYDLTRNAGWVTIGIDHDTASFAASSITRWWEVLGQPQYSGANRLLITADAGGSNGPRLRLWKWELQRLADHAGLAITVCHFPPGTSKWNKIEHRLFSHISKNWRGKPLVSLAVIVNLISSTRTETGLRVMCELDTRKYPKAVEVSQTQVDQIRLQRHSFHGDWNYTIRPQSKN